MPGAFRILPDSRSGRTLAYVFIVNSFGNGMYLPVVLLFLTQAGHWSAAKVGLAFTTASLLVVLASLVSGYTADRWRPRETAAALFVCEGLAVAALPVIYWVRSYPVLIVLLAVASCANFAGRPVWGVLIARIAGEDRVALRARLRALTNVAIALGASCAAIAADLHSIPVYLTLIFGNASSFVLAAVIVSRLPARLQGPGAFRQAPRRPLARTRIPVRANKRFLAVTLLNVPLTWQYAVLSIVVPLWVIRDTQAPRWMAGGIVTLGALLIALFQVRSARIVATPNGVSRALRRAGPLFLISTAGFALAARGSATTALLLIVAAGLCHTFGELWHAAASFEIPYAAAPDHAVGEYQGVFEAAYAIATSLAPAVLTLLCFSWAPFGWYLLGGIFLVSSLGMAAILNTPAVPPAAPGSDHPADPAVEGVPL